MRFHIHLGAHKTATTHMQLCLGNARRQLRQRGVRYFGPRNLREPPGLATALADTARDRLTNHWRAGLAARLTDCRLAVLSEENILGTMAPDLLFGANGAIYPAAAGRVARLLDFAGGHPATLFLAVRNPTDFVASAYGMHLAGGNPPVLSEYIGNFRVPALRWSRLVERLLAVEGVEQMVVWAYEDYRVARPQVLGALVGTQNVRLVPDRGRALPGWSRDAYRLYQKRYLKAEEGTDLRALAREAKKSLPKDDGRAAMQPFGPAARERAKINYARDLERLQSMERVTFLQPKAGAQPRTAVRAP